MVLLAEVTPVVKSEHLDLVAVTITSDLVAALGSSTRITAQGGGDLCNCLIGEFVIVHADTNDLAQLVLGILLKVNALHAIHERREDALTLGGGKHEGLPREVKVNRIILIGKGGATILVGVGDGEQRSHYVLGHIVCLVKQHRHILVIDMGNNDLIPELTQVA